MKVYVLSEDVVIDCENTSNKPRVFSKIENAQKVLKEIASSLGKEFEDVWEDTDCSWENNPNQYEIWEDGNYAVNHIYISIQEVEVE